MTPRHSRLLRALLTGPVTREDADRIAGASNGPDEVMKLRRQYGLLIPCTRRKSFDRDGHSVEFGVYAFAAGDRGKVSDMLRNAQEVSA